MKRAQLIGISIALVAGILAFVMMRGIVNKPQKVVVTEQVNATEVLVARSDMGLGVVANEGHFRWQVWPRDAVSPGFITRSSGAAVVRDFTGAVARAPIMAGEPITPNKLIKAGQGGVLAAILPAGMRAISTKIKEETAVGKMILPNDHVDVILTRRLRTKGGSEEFISDTLFRNVRVLAIGQQIEAREGKKGAEGTTATVELTPRQAELLALANSMGEISLSLRSVADLIAGGAGPSEGLDISKSRTSNSVKVTRYGVKSRAYGVN
jgi:pilus assembly protein CpaB